MVRRWVIPVMCAAIATCAAGEVSLEDVMRQLTALQAQVRQQQALIGQLRQELDAQKSAGPADGQQVSNLVKQEVDAAMEKHAASTAGDAPFLKLGSGIDGLALKGDLRLRYEYRDRDDQKKDNRDRMRTRLRLGAVWENSTEDWEIGAGIATGGDDPTSTNDTWSETSFFETGDVRLDYAYAKHTKTLGATKLTLTAGQQKNPYAGSWLLWDSDVRPAGFTLQAERCGLFGTVGWYDVYNGGDEICEMMGAQVGYAFKTDALSGMVAAAYYCYDDSVWKDTDMDGDGIIGNEWADSDFNFQIGDVYAELSMPLGEKVKVTVYGDYFRNVGAEGGPGQGFQMDPALTAGDEDDGWVAGLNVGSGPFKIGYSYAVIAENAANPYLVDGDFGTGLKVTDVQGHRIMAGYKVTKNCSIGLMAQVAKAMERSGVGDVHLYQLDLSYKF